MKQKRSKVLEYNVIFTAETEGGYSVIVPDLPGCISQGDTFEKAKKNIKEAIELYLEDADPELYHVSPAESRKQFIAPIQVSVA
ncbi:TPA: hypothetical protein DIV55_00075 [Patescibacteria group bacterium]|uniref:HicB-like antitoxin of toxin-antitoxin system domain-containing protein n=1 Tax=Candidatus Gottesmanbacteria bacterium GW2011_GWA1_43_11 TaxID=1618436 RepID=A0A0G1CKM9_9BACT|nr:MAG: hypothetical protein UV59_C0003G0042 [Candidatus Gottesmanbacteria bacterium GW2011_GWA1_43_11]HCS78123.1 hypothetical protein [Patescibacteria group bacterium]